MAVFVVVDMHCGRRRIRNAPKTEPTGLHGTIVFDGTKCLTTILFSCTIVVNRLVKSFATT